MLLLTREQVEAEVEARMPGKSDDFLAPSKFGGEIMVFAIEDTILSLRLRPWQKLIWVMAVHGRGLRWWWDLKRFSLSNGYEWIGFNIEPGQRQNLRQAMVRYTKASFMVSTPTGDEYCASLRSR